MEADSGGTHRRKLGDAVVLDHHGAVFYPGAHYQGIVGRYGVVLDGILDEQLEGAGHHVAVQLFIGEQGPEGQPFGEADADEVLIGTGKLNLFCQGNQALSFLLEDVAVQGSHFLDILAGLLPASASLDPDPCLLLQEHAGTLKSLGFDIVPFGTETVVVSGVPEGYEPWMIWIILEKIMTVLAVLIIIALIAYVFYRLYQKFRMDRVEEDVLSDYAETTVFIERARPEKKERMSLRERLNLPNDKKIRRLFRKKVRARIKAGDPITAAQTPQEICRTVKAEDLSRLTGLYEKARYSDIPITKEDVQSVS